MNDTNAGLRIVNEGKFTFVRNQNKLVNMNLEHGARPFPVLDFFNVPENLARTAAIAGARLALEWHDIHTVRSKPDDFFRALAVAGIVERVPGTVGKRQSIKIHGGHGLGEVDYRPGMWLHADLVLPFVQWRARRNSPTEPTALEIFVEKALGVAAVQSQAGQTPEGVAVMFAGEVDAATLADLTKADNAMIEAGESSGDRAEVLRAMLKSMRGARK